MITDALRDFLRYVPSRIIPAVAAVAAVPFLTRLLSPGEYGRYTLALAGVTFFTAISSSWITTSAIRFVPAYTQDGRLPRGIGLLVGMFLITISGSSLVAGAGALVLAGRDAGPTVYGAVALLLCAATATHEFLLGLLRSRRRATTFTTLTAVAGTAGYALAVALAALVEPSASAVIAGFLLAVVLVLPFTARRALAGVRPSFSGIPRADVREVLQYGLPALLINGLTWVTVLSDRYVLAALQGEQAVGIYAASRDLSDKMLVVLNTLFLLASTPVGVTVWERDGEPAARDFVVALTRYYLLLATPLAVGMSVLSRPLIGFLADPRYHAGYRLVPLVAVGTLCAGLATRYTLGLTFRKRTGLLSLCYVGAAVVNVGLNLVLVPRFGYMAAAASHLLSFVVLLILTRAVSRRLFAWPFPRTAAIKVGVGVSVMGLAVWFVTRPIGHPGVQLAVGVPVGIATYILAILSLHVLRPGERAALARLVGRPPASEPPGP